MAHTATIRDVPWQVWRFRRDTPAGRHYKFIEVKKESAQLVEKYMDLVQAGTAIVTMTNRIVNSTFKHDEAYDVLDIDVVFLDG